MNFNNFKNTESLKDLSLAIHNFRVENNFLTCFSISELTVKNKPCFIVEPDTFGTDIYDGMQMIYEKGVFEVSEYQAGKNQNELHIYTETKSFLVAMNSLIKGNKSRKPIKIWK